MNSPGKATTTAPIVSVMLLVRSYCPQCNRKIELQSVLGEDSLKSGNTTETAQYHVDSMKAQVNQTLKAKGWMQDMCGRCRDQP